MIRYLTAVYFGALILSAQPPAGTSETTVSGQITGGKSTLGHLTVELRALSDSTVTMRAYATSLGDFQLSGVPAGEYQLAVKDQHGELIKQDFVHIDRNTVHLDVRLPSAPAARAPGTVSLASLSHKVPGKARRELRAAAAARRHGHQEASLAHVQKALALDPQFADAHNDLGTEYVNRQQYTSALAQFDRAAQLDPGSALVEMNRAICLSNMQRLTEAETAARHAVRIDAASPRARYVLGVVLAAQKKFTAEAADSLLRASDAIPQARILAAQVFVYSGRPADAREQLHRYLANCSGKDCGRVQDWLHRLQSVAGSK